MKDPQFPFGLKVFIFKRPNLRDDGLEMEAYLGRGVLESLFDRMEMRPDVTDLVLSFPERWLNIVEQWALYRRLVKYCPNLKTVEIKTHSVIIIGGTYNTSCYIVDSDANMQPSDEGRLYTDTMAVQIINPKGLNVLGGILATNRPMPPDGDFVPDVIEGEWVGNGDLR